MEAKGVQIMGNDLEEVGKKSWRFVFTDGSKPESHNWYVINYLENGCTRPATKNGELWKISGSDLFFQLGLFEESLEGSAFSASGNFFANALAVKDMPNHKWIRIVDYRPIIVEEYDPEIHNSWNPETSELPNDLKKVESPIENIFLNSAKSHNVKLIPQVKIEKYRVDFQVEGTKIIIELDGHSYHASREQRRADALRDRKLTQKGYTVIRFTSDEIFENPNECIRQVIELLENNDGN